MPIGGGLVDLDQSRAEVDGIVEPGISMKRTLLDVAQLAGADRRGGSLQITRLRGAGLLAPTCREPAWRTRALLGANLTGAALDSADFTGAAVSDATARPAARAAAMNRPLMNQSCQRRGDFNGLVKNPRPSW